MRRAPLTVVVPCRDRPEHLERCLAALRAVLSPEDAVVVADSASADERVRAVARAGGARVVLADVPGASRARNVGWRAARTRLVAFVDDDVVVGPGWADALATAYGEGVGFVAGRVTAPAEGAGGPLSTVTTVEPPPVIEVGTPGVVGAGNLLVPVAVLEQAGGFDERLGPGTWFGAGEDVELLDRVLALGLTGRYVAAAVATHEQWRSRWGQRHVQWVYGKGMGARVALLLRRQPRAGVRLLPELLRLRGLRTAATRLSPGGASPPGDTHRPEDGSRPGWVGPVLWRLGAVVGVVAGLVVLRPVS